MKNKSTAVKAKTSTNWVEVQPNNLRLTFKCSKCNYQQVIDIYSLIEGGTPICEGTDDTDCEGDDLSLLKVERNAK